MAVVGAGAAGRSAALVLGRARRAVVLIDTAAPSNLPSTGIGGLLGHDQCPPGDFYAATDLELARYPTIDRRSGEVVSLEGAGDGRWGLTLADAEPVIATHVLLAMGMTYAYPDLPGIDEFWGASVFHCPFCHGWEHRDHALGVLAGGPALVERSVLLANWSSDVTVIAGTTPISSQERALLTQASIPVLDRSITKLSGTGRSLERVTFDDGSMLDLDGLLVSAGHRQRTDLVARSAIAVDATGHVIVDELGRTNQPRVWAVGDLTSPVSMVARAISTGATTAVWIVHQLTGEPLDLPFPPPGAPGGPTHDPQGTAT